MNVTLPNGVTIEDAPEDITQSELARIAIINNLATEEDFAGLGLFGEPVQEEEEEDETTVLGQIFETAKAVPRGFASSLLTAGEGLAEISDAATNFVGQEELINSGDANELVRLSRKGQKAVQASLGADPLYEDNWATKFGEGLGSFASFLTPGGVAKGLTFFGKPFVASDKLAKAGTNLAKYGRATQALGFGAGEQAQRMQAARDSGIEISQEDEDKAVFLGSAIGLTELAPIEKLLKGLPRSVRNTPFFESLKPRLMSAAGTGTAEGVQEVVAGIMQNAVEQNIYNPERAIIEGSLMDDFTIGGSVGFAADLVFNAIGARKSSKDIEEFRELEQAARDVEKAEIELDRARFEAGQQDPPPIIPGGAPTITDADPLIFDEQEVVDFDKGTPKLKPIRRVAFGDETRARAAAVANKLGNAFPVDEDFQVVYGSQADAASRYGLNADQLAIVDTKGNRYGPIFNDPNQAAIFAGAIKEQGINNQARTEALDIINNANQEYSNEQKSTLLTIGRRLFSPSQSTYTANQVDWAAGTTAADGYHHQGLTATEAAEKNIAPKDMTASQRINRKRLQKGLSAVNRFSLEEIRSVLNNDVGNLAGVESGLQDAVTWHVQMIDGKPAIVAYDQYGRQEDVAPVFKRRLSLKEMADEAAEKGTRSRYKRLRMVPFKDYRDAYEHVKELNEKKPGAWLSSVEIWDKDPLLENKFQELLNRKNIDETPRSQSIGDMIYKLTGNKLRRDQGFNSLTENEKRLLWSKLNQLPSFNTPTKLPRFIKPSKKRLSPEQLVEEQGEPIALPGPTTPASITPVKRKELQSALEQRLKNIGLSDVPLVVTNLIRSLNKDTQGTVFTGNLDPRGEAAEGAFGAGETGRDPAIQIAIDTVAARVGKDGDIQAAVTEILNHEVIHALRNLDLITEKEYQLLQKLAKRYKRADGRTYEKWANDTYADLNRVQRMEEATAELVRDALAGRVHSENGTPIGIGGKPRNIIRKIVEFFKRMIGMTREADANSFSNFLADLDSGVIGLRKRGEVRTFHRLETRSGEFFEAVGEGIRATIDEEEPLPPAAPATPRTTPRTTTRATEAEKLVEDAGLGEVMFSRDSIAQLEQEIRDVNEKIYRYDSELRNDGPYLSARKANALSKKLQDQVELRAELELQLELLQMPEESVYPDDKGQMLYSRTKGSANKPKKTRKAYKLFRVAKVKSGPNKGQVALYPLYVAQRSMPDGLPIGEWMRAEMGEYVIVDGEKRVKGKDGVTKLKFRPGWHAALLPFARHIGNKILPDGSTGGPVSSRKPDQVWAEVEFGDDKDYSAELEKQGGEITDRVPILGSYSFNTNKSAEGVWLIGGDMKINRILNDAEVETINTKNGQYDHPRLRPKNEDAEEMQRLNASPEGQVLYSRSDRKTEKARIKEYDITPQEYEFLAHNYGEYPVTSALEANLMLVNNRLDALDVLEKFGSLEAYKPIIESVKKAIKLQEKATDIFVPLSETNIQLAKEFAENEGINVEELLGKEIVYVSGKGGIFKRKGEGFKAPFRIFNLPQEVINQILIAAEGKQKIDGDTFPITVNKSKVRAAKANIVPFIDEIDQFPESPKNQIVPNTQLIQRLTTKTATGGVATGFFVYGTPRSFDVLTNQNNLSFDEAVQYYKDVPQVYIAGSSIRALQDGEDATGQPVFLNPPPDDLYTERQKIKRIDETDRIEETVLHELVHSVTSSSLILGRMQSLLNEGAVTKDLYLREKIKKSELGSAVNIIEKQGIELDKFTQFYEEIEKIRQIAEHELSKEGKALSQQQKNIIEKNANLRLKLQYAVSSTDELVAHAFTNEETQLFLESIPYPYGDASGKSMWTAFVDAVKKLLGLNPRDETALSAVLRVTEGALNITSQEIEFAYQELGQVKPISETGPLYSRVTPAKPIESALDIADRKYADYKERSEDIFFKKFWPKIMVETKGTTSADKIKLAARRAVRDIEDWIKENPEYQDYYSADMNALRLALEEAYGPISEEEMMMYQFVSGASSPATALPANTRDAVLLLDLYKQNGSFDQIELGLSKKGKEVIKKAPFELSGTTAPNKAKMVKTFETLIKREGGIKEAVDYLKGTATSAEINADKKSLGYAGGMSGIGPIRGLVKQVTGQDQQIPRIFMFGKKVGAYTLNLLGDSRYTTIDVWESRFIRSYFNNLFEKNTGLPVTVEEDALFQDFSKMFNEEYNKKTGSKLPASALQAMRWFYIIQATKKAGYLGASTNETISQLTDKKLKEFGKGNYAGGRQGYGASGQKIQDARKQEKAPKLYSRTEAVAGAYSDSAAELKTEDLVKKEKRAIFKYIEDNSPDPIAAITIKSGPMLYSRRPEYTDTEDGIATFETPSSTLDAGIGKYLIFQLADKLTTLKDIENNINAARKERGLPPLLTSESAYIGEETIAGKLGELNRAFEANELEPLVDEMARLGVSIDDLDTFLVYRHAIERNEQIARINPAMPDAGSGAWKGENLTNNHVKSKMGELYNMTWDEKSGQWVGGNALSEKMKRLADKIDKIQQTSLAISHKGGLLTDSDFEFLSNFYKYYVPLQGEGVTPDAANMLEGTLNARTAGSGGNLGVKGKEAKRAMGRATEAYSPISTLISYRGTQSARAIKNKSFGERLVNLIKENPNPEVWEVISPENPKFKRAFEPFYTYVGKDPELKGQTARDISKKPDKKNWVKRVRLVKDPVTTLGTGSPASDGLLGVKINGIPHYVMIRDEGLRNAALNLSAESMGPILQALNATTRFMSFVNTSANPEFVMGNFPRDIQTAIYNIIGEQTMEGGKATLAKGIISKVIRKTPSSIGVVYKGLRDPSKLTGEDKRNFDEFIGSGAKTDWFHSPAPEEAKANLQNMLEMSQGTFKGNTRAAFGSVLSFVENYNSAVENGVRFSTFVAARDAMIEKGVPVSEAIQAASTLAKNLTVNFNRKGNAGNLLNGLFLFFNASVQGTMNMMRGLNPLDPRSSRLKQGMVGGIVGFGALMAMMADELLDEEDLELEDAEGYVRDRNMVIPKALFGVDPEEGKVPYWKIPLPYGYNFFHVMGELAYQVSNDNVAPEKAAIRLANVGLGSFNPLGTSSSDTMFGSIAKTITPTIAKPVTEIAMNENYFSSPIYPADSPFGNVADPSMSNRKFGGTGEAWRYVTSKVNELTGGNEYESGWLDVSPDMLKYLLTYYTGGAGTFAERVFMLPSAMKEARELGVDIDPNKIPFYRRIVGEINSRPDTEQYYERRETILSKKAQAENQQLTSPEKARYREENKKYLQVIPLSRGTEKRLRQLYAARRQISELRKKYPERAVQYAQQEMEIQDDIDEVINNFNKNYDRIVGKTK